MNIRLIQNTKENTINLVLDKRALPFPLLLFPLSLLLEMVQPVAAVAEATEAIDAILSCRPYIQ